MAQIATAWILSKNSTAPSFSVYWCLAVTAPIVGLSSVERIKEMVEAVNIELADEDIKYLEELYVPKAVSGGLS